MKSYRLLNHIFFAILCTIFITSKSFAEPNNIHSLRKELQYYYNSGQYIKDISKVADEANAYINQQVKENSNSSNPQKLAIVLDIDETSLSYYKNMAKRNFCYNPVAAREEILKANAPAIEPILSLYNNAIKNKISVFFITGRSSYAYQATLRNLKQAGYTKFAAVYTRPASYKKNSIQKYKTDTRAKLEHEGYIIIASIGDQISDLAGGYAKKTFKLPNPYYYIS